MIWTSCKYFGLLDRFYCPVRISLSIFIVYFSKERIVTGKQRYKKLLNTANPMVFQWASISICKSCTLQGQKFFGRPLPVSFYVKSFFGNIEAKYETIAIISSPANHGQETRKVRRKTGNT